MRILLLILSISVLSACQSTGLTKGQAYPNMYEEKPPSILVVPAINRSTAADAPQLFSATLTQPLTEAGYYVFSIPGSQHYFAQEGVVDGQQLLQVPAQRFHTLFGADSVLFVTIDKWDTNYYITGGNVTVALKFHLVSTHTGETLWQHNAHLVEDTSGNSDNLVANLISTAINSAMLDYVTVTRRANRQVIATLPFGKYHDKHFQDQEQIIKRVVNSK